MKKLFKNSLQAFALLATISAYSQITETQNQISSDSSYVGTSNDRDVTFKRAGILSGKLGIKSTTFGVFSNASRESVSFGNEAGKFSSGRGFNTYIGFGAGKGVQFTTRNEGDNNTFLGSYVAQNNRYGSFNTFLGSQAAIKNINGSENTIVGTYSGYGNETGNSNTFLGYGAGYDNRNDNFNVFIGKNAGKKVTGSNNLYIGNNTGFNTNNSNTLIIDNLLDNEVSLGNLPLIWGNFAQDQLRFNVNKNTNSFVEINGFGTSSGLKFLNMNASTNAQANNGKVLSVNQNGEVIVVAENQATSTVYTIGLSNSSLNAINGGCNAYVNNTTQFLNTAVNNAIALGYKKIYIQEGVYLLNNSINVIGRFGVSVEGAGSGTILKPATSMDNSLPIINVSDGSYYCTIKNIAFEPDDANTNTKVETCIRLGAASDKNTFENLMIGRQIGGTFTKSMRPIFIDLPTGEADFNTFQNISFKKCLGGIYILATNGIFNNNKFNNINFDKATVGIEFEGNGANDNIFSGMSLQTSVVNDGLSTTELTKYFIKNVAGSNNVFRDIFVADWNPNPTATNVYNPQLQKIINTLAPSELPNTGAIRTTIENIEVQNGPENNYTFYEDLGIATQLLNCAGGNRVTDYIMKDVSELKIYGTDNYNTNYTLGKMNYVGFNPENEGKENAIFDVRNFSTIFLGSNTTNNSGTTSASNTYLRGANVYLNLGTTSPAAGQVLAASGTDGKLTWKSNSNIFDGNGWLQSDRTITMQNAGSNNNLRFNRSDLQTNMASGASDVLFLNSSKQAVAIGTNGFNNTNTHGNTYKLIVNGKARIKDECLIIGTGWADYVFQNDYKLMTLTEVENFINKNGHLPNIPKASEIEENGLKLAEITIKQQEKIEELTLYLIDLEKKLKEQNQKIELLIQQNKK